MALVLISIIKRRLRSSEKDKQVAVIYGFCLIQNNFQFAGKLVKFASEIIIIESRN